MPLARYGNLNCTATYKRNSFTSHTGDAASVNRRCSKFKLDVKYVHHLHGYIYEVDAATGVLPCHWCSDQSRVTRQPNSGWRHGLDLPTCVDHRNGLMKSLCWKVKKLPDRDRHLFSVRKLLHFTAKQLPMLTCLRNCSTVVGNCSF